MKSIQSKKARLNPLWIIASLGIFVSVAELILSAHQEIYLFVLNITFPIAFVYFTVRKGQAVKKQEAEFKQVLDAIPDLVFLKGEHSRLIWGNRAFRDCLGLTNEQLSGLVDAPFSEPDVTEQYVKDDRYVFETGKILDIPEEPVKDSTGVTRYVHTIKFPIFDEERNVIFTVGISRDISERKLHEAEIAEQRARMLASAKMSALGEMSAGIAHEINNPLAIIHSRASQLKEIAQEGELNLDFVIDTADKIEQTAIRISKIVKSLKAFTRNAEADPYESVSVKTMLEETAALCTERMRHQNIHFQISGFDPELKIICQPVQISQVILNLLNNACDAVESISEKWVSLSVVILEEKLQIVITDSGQGIGKDVATKIMQPFFTTKQPGKGTGLGLSVSKGIIESHQGSLVVDHLCKNTCFIVELPRLQNGIGRVA